MDIALIIIMFVIGLLLVIKGGDLFVDGASWLARASGIPSFIIGATIVSLATTLPELLVSVIATSQGKVDLAIGNALGSVVANLGLIMGISLTFLPSKHVSKDLIQKGLFMIAITLSIGILIFDIRMTFLESLVLWGFLIIYIYLNVQSVKNEPSEDKIPTNRKEIIKHSSLFVLGAFGVVLGARLMVDNGSALAVIFHVPEAVIGLTIVAIGTSLPELVTTIMALIKKNAGLSVGNVIGANIINMGMVIPASVLVAPGDLIVRNETLSQDIPFALLFMAIAILPSLLKRQFYRWQGLLLLVSYLGYVLLTVL